MRGLVRAWRWWRLQPRAEQRRLIGRAVQHVRAHGVTSAAAWIGRRAVTRAAADRYANWCVRHTPGPAQLARMREEAGRFAYQPLISILTPVYNTDPVWLEECAASVIGQAYPNWQWCLANDGSTRESTRALLEHLPSRDPRIAVLHSDTNAGIAAATNRALAAARGDYVALMDSDDALLPHALFRMAEHLNRPVERPDIVYSDEDKLELDGSRVEPYFKPDWSPDLFLSNMYACHLLLIRRALVEGAGGLRSEFDFSQDYDLLLRLMDRANRIDHVPDVLYHWRKLPLSGAMAGNAKPAAHLAGARALQDYLDVRGITGQVLDAGPPGFYRTRTAVPGGVRVSLLMSGEGPAAWLARLAATASRARIDVPPSTAAAAGDFLVVLGRHFDPAGDEWLDALLEVAQRPGVGVVGPRLLTPDGDVRELGLSLRDRDIAVRQMEGLAPRDGGYFGSGITIRNVAAVGGTCFVTPREVWTQLGGVDVSLAPDAAAVDYCLKVRRAGLRVVVTPWASLVPSEQGSPHPVIAPDDASRLRERWGRELCRDPYVNPHLASLE